MLDTRSVKSYSEIAGKEGFTRARVTQIMNLLKLPPEWKAFLTGLDDPKDIRKYSERRLRNYGASNFPDKPPQIKKEPPSDPISPVSLEVLKELIRKAALRKLKELEKDT